MKKFYSFLPLFIFSALLLFSSCENDDDPIKIPISEGARYGNVRITVSGNYPEGIPYTYMADYKYMPENQYSHSALSTSDGESYILSLVRKMGEVTDVAGNDYFTEIKIRIDSSGTEPVMDVIYFTADMNVLKDDNTFFNVWLYTTELREQTVTEFSYNPETNNVKFKITGELPAENNNRFPADVNFIAEGDITVFRTVPFD